jgi:hypothetical protein
MRAEPTTMNPIRSVIAVLGGFVVFGFVVQAMEMALVGSLAGGEVGGYAEYFALLNRPGPAAGRVLMHGAAGVLAGYLVARVAGTAEVKHAVATAILQLIVFAAALRGEFGGLTQPWVWAALIAITPIAMLLGATIRARAGRG